MTAYRSIIESAARNTGLDADLVEALILQESSGNADAFRFEPGFYERYLKDKPEYQADPPRRVSSSYGLCQIMLPVARELGFKEAPEYLFVPEINLRWSCAYLLSLVLWANGDLEKALGAYNAGKGGFGSPTGKAYAASVLKRYRVVQLARRSMARSPAELP